MDYSKNLDLSDIIYWCEIDSVYKIEIWKDIIVSNGFYKVSDLGRIKSLKREIKCGLGFRLLKEKILNPGITSTGYYMVNIHKNHKIKSFKIHQLVAIAFLNHKPCGHKFVVNHINFNILDNRINNLEIITQRKNTNKKHLKSTSEYTGVTWDKDRNKWRASIYLNGVAKNLGRYKNEYDAHLAYENALKTI